MNMNREHEYIPDFFKPEIIEENAWIFIFYNKMLFMMKQEDRWIIPEVNKLSTIITNDDTMVYFGKYDGHDCYYTVLEEIIKCPDNMEFVDLKTITNLTGDSGLFILAGAANHLIHWNSRNQYCGCCGHKTLDKEDERAKICPSCGNIVYPRISPATITAVFRGDEILLAHNSNFRENLYSLIAGFVEPGETLEQCVAREIKEEIGIKVKNIKYFSSQPWPFPDSLMVAFTAEYESGEIKVDHSEIMDAGWYKSESLPEIPSTDSIAGKIIRWYRDSQN